jgi:translation elongation factor EF-G
MANLDADKIRNVAVIAHGGAGKTTCRGDAFDAGSIDRLGRLTTDHGDGL